MEEKLVKTLLEQYKAQGIDLYALVDEPMFQSLPLEKKVKLMKQFASHIASGTSRRLTKNDIKSVVKDALIGGVASGIFAGMAVGKSLKYYRGGKLHLPSLGYAVGTGAAITAAGTYLRAMKIYNDRIAMGKQLDNVAKNPTDENALKALILRDKQVRPNPYLATTSAGENMIKHELSNIPWMQISRKGPEHAAAATIINNEYLQTPLAPNITKEKINDVAARADELLMNSNPFI